MPPLPRRCCKPAIYIEKEHPEVVSNFFTMCDQLQKVDTSIFGTMMLTTMKLKRKRQSNTWDGSKQALLTLSSSFIMLATPLLPFILFSKMVIQLLTLFRKYDTPRYGLSKRALYQKEDDTASRSCLHLFHKILSTQAKLLC